MMIRRKRSLAYGIGRRMLGEPFTPTFVARALARVRAPSLDVALTAGGDPCASVLLAARAAALTSRREREALAVALESALGAARLPARRVRLYPRPDAVLPNEASVRQLAERLRGGEPLHARGIARLNLLLTDAGSQIFRGGACALAATLETASAELAGADPRQQQPHGIPPAQGDGGPRDLGTPTQLPDRCRLHARREST